MTAPSAPTAAPLPLAERARDPLLVFALALLARLAHAAALARTPFLAGPIVDSVTYWQLAQHVAAGDGVGGAFYQPPLYPVILGALAWCGVAPGWSLAIVQSIAGAATAAAIAIVARRLFGGEDPSRRRRVALIAGVLAALHGPLILYDLEILPPAFVHLLLAGALLLATGSAARGPGPRDLLAGLLIGLAGTGWGHALIFVVAAIGLRAAIRGAPAAGAARTPRRALVIAALVLAGAALPIAATAAHNRAHGAPGTLISWNAGLNLWLGNNEHWRDTWRARPGAAFEPIAERARRAGAISPDDQDRWFRSRAWEDVARDPIAALARTGEKLLYVVHGREIRRNQDFEVLRAASPLLAALQWEAGVLFFPSGLIVPLAVLALWLRRREPAARVLAATIALYALGVAAFFVATRYRLPLALLTIPLAADAIVRVAARAERPPVRSLAPLALALLVCNVPIALTASLRAGARERALLLAQAHRTAGHDDRVRALADEIVSRWPDDPDAHMFAAESAVEAGDCPRALDHLERVIAGAPGATTPWIMTARCRARLGDAAGAERAYASALALDAHQPQALRGAALLYMDGGRARDAIAMLRRLHESGQGDDGTTFDLGRLLLEVGRPRDALPILEPLARRRPHDEELAALLRAARAGT